MYTFEDLLNLALGKSTLKVSIACAQDKDLLLAVKKAADLNLIEPILNGDVGQIKSICQSIDFNIDQYELNDCIDMMACASLAVQQVSTGKSHILMKGLLDTSIILKAALNKDFGLRTDSILSHTAVFETPMYPKMFLLTDAAMNITPDLDAKKHILENAVSLAHAIGLDTPKVGVICAKEKMNPKMIHTVDADALQKMNRDGAITNCIVEGPVALDIALSKEAADQKGFNSRIAGDTDILLMPAIESGNILYKALTYLTDARSAGLILGATAPIILTSRADSFESKFNSIVLGVLQASD